MEFYQCPDCLGVHGEATEPVVGIFVRCPHCLLEAALGENTVIVATPIENEVARPQAA